MIADAGQVKKPHAMLGQIEDAFAERAALPLLLVAGWEAFARSGALPAALLPAPSTVLVAWFDWITGFDGNTQNYSGHWAGDVLASAARVFAGFGPNTFGDADGRFLSTLMRRLDVPLAGVLHAEQTFEHFAPLYVGDAVEISREVIDIHDKKDGALTFIVVDTHYRVATKTVANSRQTILVRNPLEAI